MTKSVLHPKTLRANTLYAEQKQLHTDEFSGMYDGTYYALKKICHEAAEALDDDAPIPKHSSYETFVDPFVDPFADYLGEKTPLEVAAEKRIALASLFEAIHSFESMLETHRESCDLFSRAYMAVSPAYSPAAFHELEDEFKKLRPKAVDLFHELAKSNMMPEHTLKQMTHMEETQFKKNEFQLAYMHKKMLDALTAHYPLNTHDKSTIRQAGDIIDSFSTRGTQEMIQLWRSSEHFAEVNPDTYLLYDHALRLTQISKEFEAHCTLLNQQRQMLMGDSCYLTAQVKAERAREHASAMIGLLQEGMKLVNASCEFIVDKDHLIYPLEDRTQILDLRQGAIPMRSRQFAMLDSTLRSLDPKQREL